MNSGASRSIGIIVNVVAVGVMTLSLGVWISRVAKEQQTLARRLSVIESNQKKIADSINEKLRERSSSASHIDRLSEAISGLKADQIQFKSESESRSQRISSSLSSELKTLEESLRTGQDSLKSELLQLVRNELMRTAAPVTDQTTKDSESESTSGEFDGVIDSVKSLSEKSFLELYALPMERGRSKGFFLTDSGEAFYVDRANDAVVSAWDSVHGNRIQNHGMIVAPSTQQGKCGPRWLAC